jgi:hypothetical protein
MLASIFIIGTFGFWALLVASFLLVLIMTEVGDSPFWAAFTIFGTLLALDLFGNAELWSWIASNPLVLAGGAVGYVAFGIAWSMFKWFKFARKRLVVYQNQRSKFMKNHGLGENDEMPANLYLSWSDYLTGAIALPDPRKEKRRIVAWMSYWPWSVIYFVLADLVREIFQFVYNRTSVIFQRITKYVYGDFSAELNGLEELESAHNKAKFKKGSN